MRILKELFSKKEYVAVYGTLRNGEVNHYLLNNTVCLGTYFVNGWEMYRNEFYPYIIQGNGNVLVEVYEINRIILDRLDILESYPYFYSRKKIQIDNYAGVWIYYIKKRSIKQGFDIQVKSGDWCSLENGDE